MMQSTGVYVLELQKGFFYVGKSANIPKRIQQHMTSQNPSTNGSAQKDMSSSWCHAHGPVVAVHPPMTQFTVDMDTWERDELIARMMRHGFHRVRGWQILDVTEKLSPGSYFTIRNLIMGSKDLCRQCGHFGHFATECSMNSNNISPSNVSSSSSKAMWLQNLDDSCLSSVSEPKVLRLPTMQLPPVQLPPMQLPPVQLVPYPIKQGTCFRCGRYGHWVKDCFAKTHLNGSCLTAD